MDLLDYNISNDPIQSIIIAINNNDIFGFKIIYSFSKPSDEELLKILNNIKKYNNPHFLLLLIEYLLIFSVNISLFTFLLNIFLVSTKQLCRSERLKFENIISKIISLGSIVLDDNIILLSDELFFANINKDLIDEVLELECIKYGSESMCIYVHNQVDVIFERLDDNIVIVIKALENYHKGNDNFVNSKNYFVKKVINKYSILAKLFFSICCQKIGYYRKYFPIGFKLSKLDSFIVLLLIDIYGADLHEYHEEFLHKNIFKYCFIDFTTYLNDHIDYKLILCDLINHKFDKINGNISRLLNYVITNVGSEYFAHNIK